MRRQTGSAFAFNVASLICHRIDLGESPPSARCCFCNRCPYTAWELTLVSGGTGCVAMDRRSRFFRLYLDAPSSKDSRS